jgi:glycosyltransferase involved in cell wall biosynthesis
MKVILCLHHFLPDYVAGTEIYTFNLAHNLQALGVNVIVLIPNFGHRTTEEYFFENIRVIKYADSGIKDRNMVLGKTKSEGVEEFKKILIAENPDFVHFQELSPGSGMNIFYVEAAYDLKKRILITSHLSYYTCYTGNLVFKDVELCDGKINIIKCTTCAYNDKGIKGAKALALKTAAAALYKVGVDSLNWNSSIGTALGFPNLINKKKKDLLQLGEMCSKIVVLTKWYKSILESNGIQSKKIAYISQGFAGNTIDKIIPSNISFPIKIVFIGRISYYKGVHLLLEAIEQLPPDKITVDIYGPVREEQYTSECIEKSKTMRNVCWKGAIDSQKVVQMLSEYDLLCLPSTFSEMSPLVIQEAFAAGIPVLASNVYGNVEQINSGVNGWLFQFKNSNSLKERIESLINNPMLIVEAKHHIPGVKSFGEVATQYYDLYNDIISETHKKTTLG